MEQPTLQEWKEECAIARQMAEANPTYLNRRAYQIAQRKVAQIESKVLMPAVKG